MENIFGNKLRREIMEHLRKEPLSVPKLVEKIYPGERGNRHRLKARLSYHLMKLKEKKFVKVSHLVETPHSESREQPKLCEVYYTPSNRKE